MHNSFSGILSIQLSRANIKALSPSYATHFLLRSGTTRNTSSPRPKGTTTSISSRRCVRHLCFAVCLLHVIVREHLLNQKKLAEHNAFLPIQDERCERASQCIHHMCVEMGKRLTHYRQNEHHNNIIMFNTFE